MYVFDIFYCTTCMNKDDDDDDDKRRTDSHLANKRARFVTLPPVSQTVYSNIRCIYHAKLILGR